MPLRSLPLALLVLLSALIAGCGGGGESGSSTPSQPPADFWVDAQSGDDNNAGTQAAPFKTLSHAIKAAGPGKTIHALPGVYDAANGEVFPLELDLGQQLIGDIASRGLTSPATTIAGEAATSYNVEGTILMADGSRLAGFEIRGDLSPNFHHAVHIRQVTATVEHNTFAGPTYGAVWVHTPMGSTVSGNDFYTTSYGIYGESVPGQFLVSANSFHTQALPIIMNAGTPDFIIDGNTFIGTGQNAVAAWGSSPTITNNMFNKPGGYATYGAIHSSSTSSTPLIRGNTFICALAIRVVKGTPDVGTAADPGNNDFSGVTGASIQHEYTTVISAIGNTWPNTPPTNGGDIAISGGGSVIWGTGPNDQY